MNLSDETTAQTVKFMHERCVALESKLEEYKAKYEVLKQQQLNKYKYEY